jgi:hypothetical protein
MDRSAAQPQPNIFSFLTTEITKNAKVHEGNEKERRSDATRRFN